MTEKSDDDKPELSDADKEKITLHMAALGANGLAVCDCKAVTFYVGLKSDEQGNNFILGLICPACFEFMRVPFDSSPVAGSA